MYIMYNIKHISYTRNQRKGRHSCCVVWTTTKKKRGAAFAVRLSEIVASLSGVARSRAASASFIAVLGINPPPPQSLPPPPPSGTMAHWKKFGFATKANCAQTHL